MCNKIRIANSIQNITQFNIYMYIYKKITQAVYFEKIDIKKEINEIQVNVDIENNTIK